MTVCECLAVQPPLPCACLQMQAHMEQAADTTTLNDSQESTWSQFAGHVGLASLAGWNQVSSRTTSLQDRMFVMSSSITIIIIITIHSHLFLPLLGLVSRTHSLHPYYLHHQVAAKERRRSSRSSSPRVMSPIGAMVRPSIDL